jgi:molybdenum cofactor biosynthesis protein B
MATTFSPVWPSCAVAAGHGSLHRHVIPAVAIGAETMPEPSSSQRHRELAAAQVASVPIAIVTVSDSRTPETDVNRRYLIAELERMGHTLAAYRLIRDEPEQVGAVLDELAATEARLILFNGGTGIAPRDTTFDALSRKLEKVLPGFGELFRMLSYEQVGAAAMLSRATAGTYRGKLVISTPGSPAAVTLAWERLIAPELQHLAWEIVR